LETLHVLRQVIAKARFSNFEQLVEIIRGVGRRLVEAQPKGMFPDISPLRLGITMSTEHSVGNTVRKVLHHIREEYHTATHGTTVTQKTTSFSISKFVLQGQPRKQPAAQQKAATTEEVKATLKEDDPEDLDSFSRGLKPVLMEAIQDVLDELETVYDNISKNAKDHIHSE